MFQVDLPAHASKRVLVQAGERPLPARDAFRVYGRFVRERHDDFAWENDCIAHRMYGPGLETAAHDPLTSSGIDVWVKRVPRLLVNEWYMTDDYHRDHGDGADMYAVGKSRGCGGLGIWTATSSPCRATSRARACSRTARSASCSSSPTRPGRRETPCSRSRSSITLDAGSNFDSRRDLLPRRDEDAAPLAVAVGIAKHEGGAVEVDKKGRWMRDWEPLKPEGGNLGCAIVLGPEATGSHQQNDTYHLICVRDPSGKSPVRYDVGVGWDRSPDGAAPDLAGWNEDRRTPRPRARHAGTRVAGGGVDSGLKTEVGPRVPVADVLDEAAEERAIVRKPPALDVVAEQVAQQPAEILVPRIDRKLRESVSMPTNGQSSPRFDSAFICFSMPSADRGTTRRCRTASCPAPSRPGSCRSSWRSTSLSRGLRL